MQSKMQDYILYLAKNTQFMLFILYIRQTLFARSTMQTCKSLVQYIFGDACSTQAVRPSLTLRPHCTAHLYCLIDQHLLHSCYTQRRMGLRAVAPLRRSIYLIKALVFTKPTHQLHIMAVQTPWHSQIQRALGGDISTSS